MSSEKIKYSTLNPNGRSEGSGLSMDDHRISSLASTTSTTASHQESYSPFVEQNDLMVSFITSPATVTSTTALTPSTQQSASSPSLLLTLGASPRVQQLANPSTAHPSPATSMTLAQNGFNSSGSMSSPYLRIVEQPINRIRYRYKSEKGSHGGMTGESSTQTKKTYPAVKLENYRSQRQVFVKASLYTNEEVPKPHIHKLMGKCCNEDGICIVPLSENHTAVFQNLGILFVGKKEVPEIIFRQKLDEQRLLRALNDESNISEEEKQKLKEEADREAKRINLNCVRICFQAFDCNNDVHFPISEPVFSRPVANQKSPDSGELKIVRMDKYSGICTGDEEVYLLCEKVNKKEIKVRFFETDTDGSVLWEAFGNFTEADVHHQVAIVFRTPPYRDVNIENSVQVYVQLFRPKDGEYSEPRPFTYRPKEYDKEGIDRRRKKVFHYNPGFSESNFGGYSGSRYNAGGDSRGALGNPSSTQGNGLYYGQSNTQGYYRESADCEASTASKFEDADVKCSVLRKESSQRNLHNTQSVNYAQTVTQLFRNFCIYGNIRTFLSAFKQLIPITDTEGDTMLHLLLSHQPEKMDLISFFVELSASLPIDVLNAKNIYQRTVLHLAILSRSSELTHILIRNGANPNLKDRSGNTALHTAVLCGNLSVIQILLNVQNYKSRSQIAKLNELNYAGLSPLHLAIKSNQLDIIKVLLGAKADVNCREGTGGRACLHIAIEQTQASVVKSVVKLLLSRESIDVNQRDYSGNTPLHLACIRQLPDVVELLMHNCANPWIENYDRDHSEDEDDYADEDEDDLRRGKLASYYVQDESLLFVLKASHTSCRQRHDAANDAIGASHEEAMGKHEEHDSSIFDSGYASKTINMLDDVTLDKMARILDPPSTDWQILALYLGLDTDSSFNKKTSPTKYIIELFEKKGGGTLSKLEQALDSAGLHQVKEIVKEFNYYETGV